MALSRGKRTNLLIIVDEMLGKNLWVQPCPFQRSDAGTSLADVRCQSSVCQTGIDFISRSLPGEGGSPGLRWSSEHWKRAFHNSKVLNPKFKNNTNPFTL